MKKSPNLLTVSGKLLLLGDFLSSGVVRPVFRVRVPFPLNSDDWRLQRKTLVEHWFQSKGFKWLGCSASVDELSDGFVDALINGQWTGDGRWVVR